MLKRLINGLNRRLGYLQVRRQLLSRFRATGIVEPENRRELESLLGVPALINDPEVLLLQKYASLAKETIVEIGCAYGGSSFLFLLGGTKLGNKVYSIDPFIQDSMGSFQASESTCRRAVGRALKRVNITRRLKDWTLLPDYSFNVITSWTKPIDVLFIDGDHTYEAVKKDFNDWYPSVKTGGFILFHDSAKKHDLTENKYDHGWPGPSILVQELKNDQRVSLVEQVYSITVFVKNG